MAINTHRGFALIVAVSSLAYKQQVLASSATRSQYAFYAADSALECGLLQAQKLDSRGDPYSYAHHSSTAPNNLDPDSDLPHCGGRGTEVAVVPFNAMNFRELCYNGVKSIGYTGQCNALQRVSIKRVEIAYSSRPNQLAGQGDLCADITVFEESGKAGGTSWVFAQGYDLPCSKVGGSSRVVTRGLYSRF
jgi:hypothetical protein